MWDVAINEKQKKTHPERSRAAKINHKLDNRKFNTHPQTCWHTHIHKEHKQKLKSKKSVSLPQSCTVYWGLWQNLEQNKQGENFHSDPGSNQTTWSNFSYLWNLPFSPQVCLLSVFHSS